MILCGLNKLTLLDYPTKMACTLFTGLCNFRCPFCHNASLVLHPDTEASISEEEFFVFLKKRRSVLEGVCISGGEPTLQKDLPLFVEKIKEIGYLVKLDTNGTKPEMIKYLIDNHLIDSIAMDIKNSKEKYALSTGIKDLDLSPIEKSVHYIMESKITYEFRTTVVAEHHEINDFISISEWLKGANEYYLQTFKDSGDVIKDGLNGYSKAQMLHIKEQIKDSFGKVDIRGID